MRFASHHAHLSDIFFSFPERALLYRKISSSRFPVLAGELLQRAALCGVTVTRAAITTSPGPGPAWHSQSESGAASVTESDLESHWQPGSGHRVTVRTMPVTFELA